MKHIKIQKPEYIIGIPRLSSEIYTENDRTLCCIDMEDLTFIAKAVKDAVSPGYKRRPYTLDTTGVYKRLKLEGCYHFEYNLEDNEIILVKGYTRRYIVNELGEPVTHDYDIDIQYEDKNC